MKKILIFVPGFIWLIISLWLFTLPGTAIPKFDLFTKLQGDKLIHAIIFIVLCISFLLPLHNIQPYCANNKFWFLFIILVFGMYGLAIEFVQEKFIKFRSFDVGDIVADWVGCFIGFKLFIRYWIKKIGLSRNRDRNQN
ncbi:MAG TPA: VanZ family protein [Chitinophagaceae bacterium]|nr:VanZ family protein [Chitinophagaceae bacterium]MCC6633897.1 VanZ family protein [Chitinophagaceae bacterium]HMZ45646.1 VanZ family protein [Chitinophagaceae bacterium]HNE92583.1 VanZ family protein [Chitinophagaceae bacterium]HNF30402.1 VanZ family protein [Chitinophagaceae bacterium]